MDEFVEENQAAEGVKQNNKSPQAKVMECGENGGIKRRKRKQSKKQYERWVKYREQKKSEKKMKASLNQAALVAAFSNLRAEAAEFVPRSVASNLDQIPPSVNTNAGQECETTQLVEDVVEVHEENTNSGDDISDIIVESESEIADNIHTDEDDLDAGVFGILSIYTSSEIHAIVHQETIYKNFDIADTTGYFYFSLTNL
ncbi:uncharacterized protein LOC132728838 [Ruditapes philippinarum]|uniref:uncharacterized protein LOC132728838 n=1 Tax=Ruditapes philippinarum TaxID=129788 RepID=UPI00295AD62B|nr:uncharacterized protein LOC132728838 [Ruditapes philippinarum]